MGIASKTHWIGVFLLFASSILLLITSISAPVWNNVSLLRVVFPVDVGLHHTSISFGTYGYCILDLAPDSHDVCTRSHIGYNPSDVISQVDQTSISSLEAGTSDGLTRVMVLHPIACGFAFIAFLISIGSGTIGSFIGAMVAFLAWILTLVSLATDFTLFGIIHHHVNDESSSGSRAHFGSGIWCLCAAFVTLFFGMIIVFFTCCSNHREKKMHKRETEGSEEAQPARRKRFGIF